MVTFSLSILSRLSLPPNPLLSLSIVPMHILNHPQYSDKNIEEAVVFEQILLDVRNLIDQLPDDQKEVVMLRYYTDLSFKEIAEQTNVSINTALGRMRYAIINMRKIKEVNKMILTT